MPNTLRVTPVEANQGLNQIGDLMSILFAANSGWTVLLFLSFAVCCASRVRRQIRDQITTNRESRFSMTLLSLPAIRLIPSYQHIWNPLIADVSKNESGADVFLARPTVAF